MSATTYRYSSILARYFQSKPLYLDEGGKEKPHIRKLVEQPWQQVQAKMWDEVVGILCHLDFIYTFAQAKKMYDLIGDYTMVLNELPENQRNILNEKEKLKNLEVYFAEYLKFLNKNITKLNTIKSVNLNFKKIVADDASPDRIDLLNAFFRFVSNEIRLIIRYTATNSFIRQLAYNQNDRLLRTIAKPFKEDSVRTGNLFFKMDKIFNNETSVVAERKFSITGENQGDLSFIIRAFFIDFTFNQIFLASENLLQKWNVKNCLFEKEFLISENRITTFCLTPDLKYGIVLTISAGQKNILIVYDFEASKQVAIFPISEAAYFIGISANGRYAFAEFSDRIVIFDIPNNELKNEIRPIVKAYENQRFFFINNFEYLLFDESSLSVRNIETGHLVFCFNELLLSDSRLLFRFTPDLKYIFFGKYGFIYKLDLEKKKISRKLQTLFYYSDFKVTADGKYIYLIRNNQIYILNTLLSESPKCVYNHIEELTDIELSVNGNSAVIRGAGEDYVSLINFELQESLTDSIVLPFDAAFSKHTANKEYILYAKNQNLIVIGNNTLIKQFEFTHYIADENFAYDISVDGSHLVYAPAVCNAMIKNFSGNSVYQTAVPNESQITSLCVSPDCKLIATADYGDTVIISALKNGEHIKTIRDFQTQKAMMVCFSPTSRYLATSAGNKIHIWETSDFKLFKTINAHQSWITSILFSPDERTLLSASEDREIIAWDFESSNCLNILKTKGNNLKLSSLFQDNKIIVGNSIHTDDHSLVIETFNLLKFPFTTIMRTWKFVNNSEGYWDQSYSYACGFCESKIYDNEQIEKILGERYFRKSPDSENVKERKLNIIKCRLCGNYLIMNDFIIN